MELPIDALGNLGVAGAAILVMYRMFLHYSQCMIDEREESRKLEKEVRTTILTQLHRNTDAFERVLKHFAEHETKHR